MRAIWTGEIAFGLVTIPARLYTATRDLTPQFNMLHKECGTKIQMVRRCPKCQKDVEWGELGKGYEVE
jgi:DNA end-binding protein Ku